MLLALVDNTPDKEQRGPHCHRDDYIDLRLEEVGFTAKEDEYFRIELVDLPDIEARMRKEGLRTLADPFMVEVDDVPVLRSEYASPRRLFKGAALARNKKAGAQKLGGKPVTKADMSKRKVARG